MRSYHGGDRVRPGMYLSRTSGTFFGATDQGAQLPGEVTERYVRLPLLAGVAMRLMMGVGFVFFLPLVGIVGFPVFLGRRLARRSPRKPPPQPFIR
ncbi:MAG: hypothetical protein HY532_08805 [Chloroflexi bacterium]|nr:hypothetical protein [Chloroflexota bacterium]